MDNKFVITLSLLLIMNLLGGFAQYHKTGFNCARDIGDSSSCSFSQITESYYFYMDLNILARDTPVSQRNEIKKVYFKDSKMNNIPKELTITYPNIETLDASMLRLSRLEHQDFISECKIKFLNASFNKIHEITKGLSRNMKGLTTLDLSHNVIDRIDDESFKGSENLKYLNLSNNRIGKISTTFLNSLKNVEILRLDNNKITELFMMFDWMTANLNLKELYLQNNNLKSFSGVTIPSATILDLSFNELNNNLDLKYSKLVELHVRSNLLESIKINDKLLTLDASDNEGKSFEIDFNNNKVLTNLSVSNLDIPSYQKLLADIKNLPSLTYLDLSKNTLQTIDFYEAELPKTLETLNLRQCSIHSLKNSEKLLSHLPKLRKIDIRGNYLHCDAMQQFVNKFSGAGIIEGFKSDEEKEFVTKNCASDHHKHKEQEHEDTKGQVKVLWFFVIFFLLGYVVVGVYFLNKRYNFLGIVRERVTSNGFVHHEFTPNSENYVP